MVIVENGKKKIINKIGTLLMFLLLLVVMVDPTNVSHLKDVAFLLLVMFNIVFYKPIFTYLPYIFLPYIALVISYISSTLLGTPIENVFFMGMMKSFSMLILLLWVPYYNILKLAKITAFITCLIATILFIAVVSNELIETVVYEYMSNNNAMVLMSHRSFLGITIFGMYYRSLISTVLPFYLYCYALFVKRTHVVWNFICVAIITFAFFISGTRSTMLLPFVIIGLAFYQSVRHTKWMKNLIYPLLIVGSFLFLFVLYKLASEKGETSNAIKYGHLISYQRQFEYFPIYYIMGQGTGSWLYSAGFRSSVTQTEWTYLELLRMCGIFMTFIMMTLFYPLFAMRKYFKNDITLGIAAAYVMFIFISGTNPLLMSSTGMVVVLMAFAYISKLNSQNK